VCNLITHLAAIWPPTLFLGGLKKEPFYFDYKSHTLHINSIHVCKKAQAGTKHETKTTTTT